MGIYYNQQPPIFIGGAQPFGPSLHGDVGGAEVDVMTQDQLNALRLVIDLLLAEQAGSEIDQIDLDGLKSLLRDARNLLE